MFTFDFWGYKKAKKTRLRTLLNQKEMAIFKFFGSKPSRQDNVSVVEEGNVLKVVNNEENDTPESNQDEKPNLITITWGTGMPIDVIFNFIHKNFEEEGFQDALVNSEAKYCETREEIIRNDLKMLFERISLKYKCDIREAKVRIENAKMAFALNCVSQLESLCQTYEEHLAKIEEMDQMLNDDNPKVMNMIESYRRGFQKGVTASIMNFINNK